MRDHDPLDPVQPDHYRVVRRSGYVVPGGSPCHHDSRPWLTMWRRFVSFADRHAWVVTLAGVAFMMIVLGLSLSHENAKDVARAKHEADERATQIAITSIETCKHVVVTLTEQSRRDDLRQLQVIKDRYAELGRPAPALLLLVESEIQARQAPTASCEPKKGSP